MAKLLYILLVLCVILYAIDAQSCRRIGNRCRRDRQCCSGSCGRGRRGRVCRSQGNGNSTTEGTTVTGGDNLENGEGDPSVASSNLVNRDEFNNAVTSNGGPTPRDDQWEGFSNGLSRFSFSDKREAAMALAQFLHETEKLTEKEERACKDTKCPSSYSGAGCEVNGQYYFGRGYLQLSWCYNYRDASSGLGLGDLLLNQPDLVASNEEYAWNTAFWYWDARVRNSEYGGQVREGKFGASTRAINGRPNGGVECNGENVDESKRRFEFYRNVFAAFGVPGQPDETGCYN